MTWFTAPRIFCRAFFAHCTAEKFVKFGVQFLALRNQFFDPGDLGVMSFRITSFLRRFDISSKGLRLMKLKQLIGTQLFFSLALSGSPNHSLVDFGIEQISFNHHGVLISSVSE